MLGLLLRSLASCSAADCEDTRTCNDGSLLSGGSSGKGASSGEGGDGTSIGGRGGTGGGKTAGGSAGTGGGASGGASGSDGEGGSADSGAGAGGTAAAAGAGTSGSGGEGGFVPVCDTSKAPNAEACLVTDEFAVFVSATGADDGDGSKAAPFASIAEAIAAADAAGKFVVACSTDEDVFATAVELSGEIDAKVYGGFRCSDWTFTGERTKVAPESGVALKLDGVSGALHFEDFEFRASDAVEDGESSVAAVFNDSEGVSLRRVTIAAGKGAKGEDGEAVADYAMPAVEGHDATGETAGAARTSSQCMCDTRGGRGGDSEGPGGEPADGEPGDPALGAGDGGKGGASCTNGGDGANAPPAARGDGASNYGALTGVVWTPRSGEPGQSGGAGQGGGGGGGAINGGGGGGACGGCGGKGGNPGGGGGASIAIIWISSDVQFFESRLETADGGDGGSGAPGQSGQLGGDRGGAAGKACPGGNGGNGADGGSGGGGIGGISVGILYKGKVPAEEGLTIVPGMAGNGGDGGDPGVNDGGDGTWAEILPAAS